VARARPQAPARHDRYELKENCLQLRSGLWQDSASRQDRRLGTTPSARDRKGSAWDSVREPFGSSFFFNYKSAPLRDASSGQSGAIVHLRGRAAHAPEGNMQIL